MPRDDDAAAAADQHDFLAAPEDQLSDLASDAPIGLGRTVVAGPPDDALEMAQREILAALFGAPTAM